MKIDKNRCVIAVNDELKSDKEMVLQKSRLGTKFISIYLILMIVAFIFFVLTLKKTPFAGIYLGLLTFPWSFFIVILLDSLGVMDSISIAIKFLLFISGAIPNAVILYHIGAKIERAKNKKGGTFP